MGHELGYERTLTIQELKEFLVRLADSLDRPDAPANIAGMRLTDLTSLKLSLKRLSEGDGRRYEMKLKAQASAEELAAQHLAAQGSYESLGESHPDDRPALVIKAPAAAKPASTRAAAAAPTTGQPKYKDLKKRMKVTFKALLAALAEGRLPGVQVVESFLLDSRTMVSFPGKGDQYYAPYNAAVEAFRKAWNDGRDPDPEALRRAAQELDAVKHQCHEVYK